MWLFCARMNAETSHTKGKNMAYGTIEIKLDFEWHPTEPDGSECEACHEACYLTQWKLLILMGGKPLDEGEPIFLCGSCHDAIVG